MMLTKLAAVLGMAPLAAALASGALAQSMDVPVESLSYTDLGGPQLGTLWGDAATGPHGSLLRLPVGFVSPEHTHSADYEAVVISGTVSNAEIGAEEVPLEPGSFYRQAGGTAHVTRCLGETECVLYIVQDAAFDFLTE
jgi:uncharacterized cupin superfamily protein